MSHSAYTSEILAIGDFMVLYRVYIGDIYRGDFIVI